MYILETFDKELYEKELKDDAFEYGKKEIYGRPVKSWKYDYLSISFIRLSAGKKENSKHRLIHMLDTLFSEKLDAQSKKKILETEHQMEMTRKLEGEINTMCNVSLGIRERALAEGLEQGEKRKLYHQIQMKLSREQSLEKIAEDLMEDINTIKEAVREMTGEKQ